MRKLSEHFDIPDRWIRGSFLRYELRCEGNLKVFEPSFCSMKDDAWDKFFAAAKYAKTCLVGGLIFNERDGQHMQAIYDNKPILELITPKEEKLLELMAKLVVEYFPQRAQFSPNHTATIIYFNDHNDTTFDDIQFIASEYDRCRMLEMEQDHTWLSMVAKET